MRKILFILCLTLLLPSVSISGGLFAGCYGSGFGTHGFRADTEAYITRVEADGGEVINPTLVDAAYQLLADNSISPLVWVDPNFGVKKNVSDLVETLYDISDNDHDATQTTEGYRPLWVDDQQGGMATIQFNGSDEFLTEGTQLGKPASFTACTVFKTSNITTQTAIWMNRTETGDSTPWWGALVRYNSNGDMGLMTSTASTYTGSRTATGQIGTSSYYLRTDRYATGSDDHFIYLNTTSLSLTYAAHVAETNSGTSFDFRIGMYGDAAIYYTGYIGSLLIISSSLSDTDRGYCEAFINSYYGIY